METEDFLWKASLDGEEDVYGKLEKIKPIFESENIHAEIGFGDIRIFAGQDNNLFAGYPLIASLYPRHHLALTTDQLKEMPPGLRKLTSLGYHPIRLRQREVLDDEGHVISIPGVLSNDIYTLNEGFIRASRSKKHAWI